MLFRIFKMIATSGFLTALESTKFVFRWSSAPDPAGGANSAPQTKGLRGAREGNGKRTKEKTLTLKMGGERTGKGRGQPPPNANSWIRP